MSPTVEARIPFTSIVIPVYNQLAYTAAMHCRD